MSGAPGFRSSFVGIPRRRPDNGVAISAGRARNPELRYDERHMSRRYAERLTRRHPWLPWVALVACGAGLVATSDPTPRLVYRYARTLEGPPVELTAAASTAKLRIRVRATDKAPNGAPTTLRASAVIHGQISATELQAGAASPLVFIRVSKPQDANGSAALNALTQFSLASEPQFEGDCEGELIDPPCVAELDIELSRLDSGSVGGTVRVDWASDWTSEVEKSKAPSEGPLQPPWEFEISAESSP